MDMFTIIYSNNDKIMIVVVIRNERVLNNSKIPLKMFSSVIYR